MSAQGMSGEGVDGDFSFLPHGHVSELCFLEVGDDPYIRQGRKGRDLAAHPHQLPGFDLALTDHTVLGCRDRAVSDIELGRLECRALCRDCCFALCDLRFEDPNLTLGGQCLSVVLLELSLELRMG